MGSRPPVVLPHARPGTSIQTHAAGALSVARRGHVPVAAASASSPKPRDNTLAALSTDRSGRDPFQLLGEGTFQLQPRPRVHRSLAITPWLRFPQTRVADDHHRGA